MDKKEKTLVEELCEAEDLPSLVAVLRLNRGYDSRDVVLDLMGAGEKARDTKIKKEDLIPLLIIESIEGEDDAIKDRLYSVWRNQRDVVKRRFETDKRLYKRYGKKLRRGEEKYISKHERLYSLNQGRMAKSFGLIRKSALETLGSGGLKQVDLLRKAYYGRMQQLNNSFNEDQECIFSHFTSKSGFPAAGLLFSDLWDLKYREED